MRRSHESGPYRPTTIKRLVLAMGLMAPGLAAALGLGNIAASTQLNQPLKAEIPLVEVAPADVKDVQVRLGSADAFKRLGIARPAVLSRLRFTTELDAAGKPVVEVQTDDPVKEPFLNFLVEVRWPKGRMLREYTLLLDVPVVAKSSEPAVVEAPQASQPAPVAEATSPAPQSVPQTAASKRQQAPARAEPESVIVRRNDTLSAIAMRNAEAGVALDQMMIALYRANRHAFFDNNINNLRAGVTLQMPDGDAIAKVRASEARRLVAQHMSDWRRAAEHRLAQRSGAAAGGTGAVAAKPEKASTKPAVAKAAKPQVVPAATQAPDSSGRLEILADNSKPSDAGSPTGGKAGAGEGREVRLLREQAESRAKENQDLAARVKQLEGVMTKQQKVIDIQQQELTDLQQKLKAAQSVPAAKPAVSEPAQPAAPKAPAQPERRSEAPSPAGGAMAEHKPAAEKPAVAHQPANAEAAPTSGSGVKPKNLLLAAGAVALVVAVAAGMARRRDKHQSPSPSNADRRGIKSVPTSDAAAAGMTAAGLGAETNNAPLAADRGEGVLADADVYLAYGLHAQAEQLLGEALQKEPERDDYRMKLVEVYYSAKSKNKFDLLAGEIHERTGGSGPLWERVYGMGQDISPDNALFFPPPLGGDDAHLAEVGEHNEAARGRGARWAEFLGQSNPSEDSQAEDAELSHVSTDEHATKMTDAPQAAAPMSDTDIDSSQLAGLDLEAAPPAENAVASAHESQPAYTDRTEGVLDSELEQAFAVLDETVLSDAKPRSTAAPSVRVPDEDGGASFAEDVGAKLDLAKAYLDMGDSEGARSLLADVMTEGSSKQREEARRLHQQIG